MISPPRKINWLTVSVIVLFLSPLALGAPKFVSVGKIRPVTIRAGARAFAVVPVRVLPPFRVQANPATLPTPMMFPVTLNVDAKAPISVGSPVYPPGKPYHLKTGDQNHTFMTYDGAFTIRLPLSVARGAKPHKVSLKGTLSVQACNDQIFYQQTQIHLEIPVVIKR